MDQWLLWSINGLIHVTLQCALELIHPSSIFSTAYEGDNPRKKFAYIPWQPWPVALSLIRSKATCTRGSKLCLCACWGEEMEYANLNVPLIIFTLAETVMKDCFVLVQ